MSSDPCSKFIHNECEIAKSTVFKFDEFKKEICKNIPNEWLEWLIGLYEGDGTIISRDKGFTFCIYSVHKPTLENIKSVLGFGSIIYNKKEEKYTYLVENPTGGSIFFLFFFF